MRRQFTILLFFLSFTAFSQDEAAYGSSEEQKNGGLFDPSRLSIRNSVSFGAMSSNGVSGLKSQSLYTTMMQYQFVAPVTLNLNFSLPIHSTFSQANNLSASNLQSLDYFKNMPFEMSLSWQPTKNTLFRFSVSKAAWGNYFYNDFAPYHQAWDPFYRNSDGRTDSEED
jgi:hypothetical protein